MKSSALFLLTLCSASSCAGTQEPHVKALLAKEKSTASLKTAEVMPPPSMDLSSEIMGTLVSADLDSVLKIGTGYVLPHLPPPLQTMAQPDVLLDQLFKAVKAPELRQAIDTGRPFALAMADPTTYRGDELGPLLLGLPVRDAQALITFLGKSAGKHESTPFGDHLFTTKVGVILLRLQGGWAFLASHEKLLHGAAQTLLPLLQGPIKQTARVQVHLGNIFQRYGAQIEEGLTKLADEMIKGPKAAETAASMLLIQRWFGYFKDMQSLSLTLDLRPNEIHSRVEAQAKGGAFRSFLAKLDGGEPWGAKYLPKDGVLFALGRESEASRQDNMKLVLQILKGLLKDFIDEAASKRWGDAAETLVKCYTGETALGFWITTDGGVGMGSVNRLKDAKAARAAVLGMMKLLSQELSRLFKKALPDQVKQELMGAGLELKVRPNALVVGGLKGDLYEIVIRWPRLKNKEELKKLDTVRKGLTKVMGPRLALGFVTSGDVGISGMGKDMQQRMAAMLAIAKGGPGTGMEKILGKIAGAKKTVSVFYSPLVSLTEGVLRVVDHFTPIPPDAKGLVQKILPGPGKEAPLGGVLYTEGDRLILDTEVSPEIIGLIVKGAMQAMAFRGGVQGGGGAP